jgi:small-conductance mechanosensitive channel
MSKIIFVTTRILHYFIVLVGLILALLTLGFDLTNITIIGGALGCRGALLVLSDHRF